MRTIAEIMYQAGLCMTGNRHEAKCLICGFYYKGFENDHQPFTAHKNFSPKCELMLLWDKKMSENSTHIPHPEKVSNEEDEVTAILQREGTKVVNTEGTIQQGLQEIPSHTSAEIQENTSDLRTLLQKDFPSQELSRANEEIRLLRRQVDDQIETRHKLEKTCEHISELEQLATDKLQQANEDNHQLHLKIQSQANDIERMRELLQEKEEHIQELKDEVKLYVEAEGELLLLREQNSTLAEKLQESQRQTAMLQDNTFTLMRIAVIGDGNCFYRAICLLLPGCREEDHPGFREAFSHFCHEKREYYGFSDQDLQQIHTVNVSVPRNTLYAMANFLKRRIFLWSVEVILPDQSFCPDGSVGDLHLLNEPEIHIDALLLK